MSTSGPEKKQASPTTIMAMVGGTVIALSFTIYTLVNSMAPPQQQAATPTPTAPAPDAAAPVAQGEAAGVDNAVASAAGVGSEAFLAADANPFAVIPKPTPTPPPVPANRLAAAAAAAGSVAPPPALPRLGSAPGVAPGVLPPMPVAPPAAPELVGTLQGLSPSAVLRGDGRTAVVSVGESFRGWKVIRVDSSGAVLRGAGQTLRLSTLGFGKSTASAGSVTAASTPAPAPQIAQAPAPAPVPARTPAKPSGNLSRLLAAREGVRWADESAEPEELPGDTVAQAPVRELPRRKVVFVDPAPAPRPEPRLRTASALTPRPRMSGLSTVVDAPVADPVLTPSSQAPGERPSSEPSLSPDNAVPPTDGADDAAARLRKAAGGA